MATVTKGVLKLHTKWTARRLAADAMFAAMVTVLAAAAIKTGNLKITIEAMPVFLGALMLGPVDGMVIGGIGTLLYQLLSYGVTATTALWIAPARAAGRAGGVGHHGAQHRLAVYRQPHLRVLFARVRLRHAAAASGHLRGEGGRVFAAAAVAAAARAPRGAAARQLTEQKNVKAAAPTGAAASPCQ